MHHPDSSRDIPCSVVSSKFVVPSREPMTESAKLSSHTCTSSVSLFEVLAHQQGDPCADNTPEIQKCRWRPPKSVLRFPAELPKRPPSWYVDIICIDWNWLDIVALQEPRWTEAVRVHVASNLGLRVRHENALAFLSLRLAQSMATEEYISQSPKLAARHLIFRDIVFRHSGLVKRNAWRTFCTNTGEHYGDRCKWDMPQQDLPTCTLGPNTWRPTHHRDALFQILTHWHVDELLVSPLLHLFLCQPQPHLRDSCLNVFLKHMLTHLREFLHDGPPWFAPPCDVSGTCSAKRPNKGPCGVAQGFVLFGKKSTEEEAGMLSLDEGSARSRKMRNMTCARGWWFLRQYTKRCNLSHAREKFARVESARWCVLTFYNSRRLQKNGHIL